MNESYIACLSGDSDSCIIMSPCLFFQVSLPDGLHHTVTVAAKMAKEIKEKAGRPATNYPPLAATANRKPAPHKRLLSVAPSPASPTYRLWIGQSRKVPCSYFSSLKSGGKATCSEL